MNSSKEMRPAMRLPGAEGFAAAGQGPRMDESYTILPQPAPAVKMQSAAGLVAQAEAAERRAAACAAWHRERAARYLAWVDSPWCAAQYTEHTHAADYQERLAARQRQIAAALQGVDHG